ncbi:hypothetical protein SAMN02799630_05901 [Paenibacillus sp. UNCCL117]|uniref:hypothetical protein n=1 Tax=unclassified Paenibacillus TaxID=185978 RepID=UPI0008916F16|nr:MULTISPECIES: hypothetical protein [unclassified Paenibacillus]SDE60369.1 hypothetical protein SAMN04488602_13521 [Paenibacillus sp. cl123]SFW69517.1 hypothetical protein SAMN02799630_05901 [Paenibacillus sp. UNCCL117]
MASSKKLTKVNRPRVASLTGESEHASHQSGQTGHRSSSLAHRSPGHAQRNGQLAHRSGSGEQMLSFGEQGLWPMQQPGLPETLPLPAVVQPEEDCPPEPPGHRGGTGGGGSKPRHRRHPKGCRRICRCVKPAGSRTKRRTGAATRRTGTGTGSGTARRRTGGATGAHRGCGCAPRRIGLRPGCKRCGFSPLRGLSPLGRRSCGCRRSKSR